MSTVRVNLLPDTDRRRAQAGRQNVAIVAGFVVLLGAVGAGWWLANSQVTQAQAELAAEEGVLADLRAERARLGEFEELDTLIQRTDNDLAATLGSEVTMAGLLQDLAAVMPADVELTRLAITLSPAAEASLGDERDPIGLASLTGRSIQGHAPGVERLLLALDKLGALDDLFMSNSTVEAQEVLSAEVVQFTVEADLGPEARTGRYAAGIPEVLR
jgi:Tfp pilus assembly protein PilN